MSSKSNSKEAIILTDWIRRALVGINLSAHTSCGAGTDPPSQCPDATICNSSVALFSSDDYLMPALQLAYSLVNQICNEEEASGKSPTLSVDWVDNIVVYGTNPARRSSLDSLGFDPCIAVDNFDAEDLFESTIHDRDGGAALSEEKRDQSIEEGCDSIRAEFAPSLFSANDDDGLYSRIYSLGVVFHVLFSGGERSAHHFPTPTELLETQKLRFKSDETEELLSHELSKDLDLDHFERVSGDLDIFDSTDGSDPFFGDETFDDAPTQFLDPKKRYASQQQNRDNSNNCCAPVESLREKGLPNSLCDLVANMLDCTNGTLSGEDSYQNMSDVRSDLRLMLDNPNTFLRDLDMTKLSTRGPQFIEKTMFGRNVELSIIKDAYRRSISGEYGLLTISGTSGTGKSLLAKEFGKFVSADGGIFLSGKFDQLQQGIPFSALASTFDQYCGILLHEGMTSTKEEVAFQLRSVLGKGSYHLTKIIPNLAAILGTELPIVNHSDDCIKAQKRLQYLFCQFVEVISNSSSAPITLFLDDLQWADAASIAAVNQLLFATGSSSQKKKKIFFVLGCIRVRDSATKWLPCVDVLVAGGINVKLDCMDKHTLNTMVSETLCLSPRLTHTLSNVIYHETEGNPLSVSRLMRLLNKEGMLRPSLNRRRWEWDVKKIRSAMFLTESLEELPDIGNCYPLTNMRTRHISKSNQPIAAASSQEPVPLKQWMVGAVDSLRSRSEGGKGEIVCSHEYLSCALQIAHSLANQLSTVEQERAYKKKTPSLRNNNSPPITEALDKSWSEYISVYCVTKTKDVSAKFGFEPLLSSKRDNVDPGELHNLAQQLSTLLETDDNHQKSIDYLDVRGAILNEGAVDGRPLSENGKLEILSLGIAFYELFSGGQLTAAAETLRHTAAESEVGEGDELFGNNPTKRRSLQSNTSLDSLSQVQSASMASISVEGMKLLGLPTALCDLISNMIVDSVDGDAHDNGGTYGLISEVRDDLKLMIDSPSLYLQDVDLAKAVNVGLQFGGSLYGREAELQTLNECYQRSISSECEVAMICGTSGIGKSKLSREFARSVNEDGTSIFLSGSFDRLESQPLHAISSAFDKYCAWVTAGDQSTAEKVSTALKENMGDEMACLVTVMPNLANILGDDFNLNQSSKNDDTAVDAQKRLRYLFCQFVDVISRCHEEPLILFLDDCQWIDNASVALLNQILMISGSAIKDHRFFFFGACRDDEMSRSHPLNSMLTSVNSFGTKTTKIHLTSMSKGALNEMVSTELSLLPRITRPLANILHHKTKGSPLFVKQVMMELYKQRLLYPSLSRRRWVWETNKILDMKIPDNVATFITNTFDRLSFEVVSALVVLSCFGASADISLIEVLEKEIEQPLIAPLDDAVAHSVLGKRNGKLHFMHDKLQEAAYSKMRPEERCLHHNRYGLALGFVAVRERNDRLLLTAVTQINHGGPQAVIDDEQAVVVASLNLDAGKKAMNLSDFFAAHSFFEHGISYLRLRREHWNEHYDLSLELFNLAAKCALMNAEHDSLKVLTEQIMHNAKCFEDKLQAISVTVGLLNWSGNVPAAVELIRTTLSSLDEELPSAVTPFVVNQHLDITKTQLANLSDDILLSYPAMVNPSKILVVELLVKLYDSLTLVGKRAAMPIIPLTVIQLSLTYGMSPHSPSAFAQYGNYLALIEDEFEEGYRYIKFALSLMKKLPSRAHVGSTLFYSSHTRLYVEPMQSSIEFYLDAYKAHMKSGNPYAVACSFVYNNCCLLSGKELNAVVASMRDTMKESKYHKNSVVLTLMLPMFRVALRLIGQSDAPASQQDNLTNASDKTLNEGGIAHTNLFEALIFRELNEARDAADKYFSVDRFGSSSPAMFFGRFYSGLVSFWIARESNSKKKKKWIRRGVECKDKMEKLSDLASTWNFENKLYLLQAEEQFCSRNFEMAETLYDAAIASSKIHKFVNEEALANELAGHFYLETGRTNRSAHYFSRAFEKYNEWGAVAKANTLTEHLDESKGERDELML